MRLLFRFGNKTRVSKLFSRKSVDIERVVESRYLSGNVAVISYNTDSYAKLIDSHSPSKYEMLNPEFVEYLENNAKHISTQYPIILEICGMEFGEMREQTIRQALRTYYELELGECQHEKQSMIGWGIAETVLMVICYLIYAVFNDVSIIRDAFSLLFWIFGWSLGDMLIFQIAEYSDKRKKAAQMASISVKFYKRFIDDSYSREEQEQLIRELLENENSAKAPDGETADDTETEPQDEETKQEILK